MTPDTNTSLWAQTCAQRIETAPLADGADVDLAIVGGGFTGCAAALAAAGAGARVALLEARHIAHGGSGRNVGLVNAGLWLPPDAVIAQLGEAPGRRLLQALSEGPATVFGLVETHGIDCEATRAGTLHLAHSPAGLDDLRERHRQGNAIGAPLALLDADETARRTGSPRFHGALLDPRAGTVQPLAYCMGLARAAQAAGAALHEATPVDRIQRDGSGWVLTANGVRLRAGAVLVATNGYHAGLRGVPAPSHSTVSYSQFATAPLSPAQRARILSGGEGCWDTALVMSSIRIDRAGRLIVGSMGDVDGPGRAVHASWARRKLARLFPRLTDAPIETSWQGRIAMTSDHIPKVVRFGPRACTIFGYSGRGIAPGTVFGTAAAEALLNDRPGAFPIETRDAYSEPFTGIKSAYYEFGATLTHAVQPSPLG